MERMTSGRRPRQEHSGRSSRSHRQYERTYSMGNLSFGEKGENWGPYERQSKKEITETTKGSNSRGAITRQSQIAKGSRHKRSRSPSGSPCSGCKENGYPEEEVRGQTSPAQGRGKDKPKSTRAGHQDKGVFARPSPQLKDRKTLPRRPARTTGRGRCQDNPEAGPASPKRHCRHLSPEARAPLAVLTSRLFNQVDALEVVLDELRAPGGAFLPVPSRGTQPTASQRAWLSWQLAHAGANLHWALASLDTLLAAHPRLTCQQPCVPHAP